LFFAIIIADSLKKHQALKRGEDMEVRRKNIPPDIIDQIKAASRQDSADPASFTPIRYSKKQLQDKFGLTIDGGGLVCINNEVYAFVESKDNPGHSHVIGEGTSGRVKLLQNVEKPNDQKALKVMGVHKKKNQIGEIKPTMILADSLTRGFVTRDFEKELKIAEKLGRGARHVIAKQGENGHTSICGVLELAKGQDLSEIILSETTDASKRLALLKSCFEEVEFMHERGIMHNDIKPGNFRYDSAVDKVLAVDFGNVVEFKFDEDGQPVFGELFSGGTPGYMPPELWDGTAAKVAVVTTKNDVFALGKTLEECFALNLEYEKYQQYYDDYLSEGSQALQRYHSNESTQQIADRDKYLQYFKGALMAYKDLPEAIRDELKSLSVEMTNSDPKKRCDLSYAKKTLNAIMARQTQTVAVNAGSLEKKGSSILGIMKNLNACSALSSNNYNEMKVGEKNEAEDIVTKYRSSEFIDKFKKLNIKVKIEVETGGVAQTAISSKDRDCIVLTFTKANRLHKAMCLGGYSANVSLDKKNKNKIRIAPEIFEQIHKMQPEEIDLLMRLSVKYDALQDNSDTHKDKRKVLEAAVKYLLSEGDQNKKFAAFKAVQKQHKKWNSGYNSEVAGLIQKFIEVTNNKPTRNLRNLYGLRGG